MRIFKPFFILIAVLWGLLALFLFIDVAGPILGAPPTASSGQTATPPAQGSKNTKPKENTNGAGPLYQVTRNIPPAVNNLYFYHFFHYPLPLLFSFLLWRHIRNRKRAQLKRQEEVAASSISTLIGPPVDDVTPWEKSWGLLADWFNLLSELEQNAPKERQRGYGLHAGFGYISRVGDGIRLTARIPAPPKETPVPEGGKQPKGKKAEKLAELKQIPDGLPVEFVNLVRSRYEFCQVQTQLPGVDPLDLDSFPHKQFDQRRKSIGQVVSAFKLLKLSGAGYQPIKTTFLDDPTAAFYQKLNPTNDSNLTACGVEIVLVPAMEWQKEADAAIQQLANTELGHQTSGRQALSTSGGKSADTGRAATSRASHIGAKAQRETVEARLESPAAFSVFVYVWAEGSKSSVEARLSQLVSTFSQYTLAASSKNGAGNRFQVIKSGQGLTEVRRRAYPVYFAPEPSVLTVQELAALWHIPNSKVKGPIRAGAMSPPPDPAIIHRLRLPDGTVTNSDDKWRRVIGTYSYPDGMIAEVGISELGCSRGMDVTGRPGSGKSVDLETLIVQDCLRDDTLNVGKGGVDLPSNSVVVADPNGDFIYDTIDRLPASHEKLCVLIDPLDTERVAGLNPMAIPKGLEADTEEGEEARKAAAASLGGGLSQEERQLLQKLAEEANHQDGAIGLVASSMIEVFAKTQGVSMDTTPTIYRVISNAIRLAVSSDQNATIWTLLRLINDAAYRQAMVNKGAARDPLAKFFWEEEFATMADKQGGAALAPTRSRLENLLRQESIRRLLTQRMSTLNLRNAIDKGYVTLFRFSPQLGADKSFLLAVTFNLVKQAVFSRADIPKEQRRMVSVYLDEFQEIVGSDSATLQIWLEQARKFGGAITLAHQNLAQVKQLIEAMKGTVGSFIPMLVGPDDRDFYSKFLDSEEWPRRQIERAFAQLPAYSKVARLFDLGRDYTPVLLNSLPRMARMPSDSPIIVAVRDSKTAFGYRIEPYNEGLHGTLQESTADGMEGFWEPSPSGLQRGIQPATPNFCPNLIEELTVFLHRQGALNWGLRSRDPRTEERGGFSEQEIARINASGPELKEAQQLLLNIERLGTKQREDELAGLDERKWLLYRMSRKGRDMSLRTLIFSPRYKGLIPEKRNRVITGSRLMAGTPIAEIEAESKRPDAFTAAAAEISKMMEKAAEKAAAEKANRGGSGQPHGKSNNSEGNQTPALKKQPL